MNYSRYDWNEFKPFSHINNKKNPIRLTNRAEVDRIRKNLKKLSERYCYVYKNSPYLLAVLLKDIRDNSLYDEVNKRINFDFKKIEFLNHHYPRFDCLALLEDILLGVSGYNRLRVVIGDMKETSSIDSVIKSEFDLDRGNIGIGKFDSCMHILLDLLYTFVNKQSYSSTRVFKKKNGYDIIYADNSKQMMSYADQQAKMEILDLCFNILSFRNSKEDYVVFNKRGLEWSCGVVPRTLVSRDNIIEIHPLYYPTSYIVREVGIGSDIYFKLHDELPSTSKCTCNDINGVREGCGNTFHIKEEDIFYLDNQFEVLCPNCGSVCTIGDTIGPHPLKNRIENRIKKRSFEDKFLRRKIELLSELYSFGDLEESMAKVKSKV